jgi:hypothetical protein
LSFSSNTITKFAFHIFYLTIFFIIFWFNIKLLNKNIYPRKWFYQKLYHKVDFFSSMLKILQQEIFSIKWDTINIRSWQPIVAEFREFWTLEDFGTQGFIAHRK